MEKSTLKRYILISTYIVLLYLFVSHLGDVASVVGAFFTVLMPIIVGLCIAFVMNVLMSKFEKHIYKDNVFKTSKGRKLKRIGCIFLTYAVIIFAITILVLIISPQVIESLKTLAVAMPGYVAATHTQFMEWGERLELTDDVWNTLMSIWQQFETSWSTIIKNAATTAIDVTVSVTKGIVNFLIGLILAAYLLYSKEKLVRISKKVCYAVFFEKAADKIVEIASEANKTFSRFIGGQLAEAIVLGVLCFLGMTLMGIPYAPLISCLVAVMSLIPVIGVYIGTIPSAIIILMENPVKALVFVIFIIVLQQINGKLIYPRIVGTAVGLDGLWVFIAILLGAGFGGVIGMLICVPLMALAYSLVSQYTHRILGKKSIEKAKYESG